MTNEHKDKIAEMRGQGCTYADIAENLLISENTIKTYCRRARLAKDAIKATPVCKQCGCSIEIKDKYKVRQFCTDKCRAAWWYANRSGEFRTEYHLTCSNCGRPFVSVGNKARKYCSHRCYIAARFGDR